MNDTVKVQIEADTSGFENSIRQIEGLADSFGRKMTSAMSAAAIEGRALDGVLKRLALDLASLTLKEGLKPLQGLIGQAAGGLFGGAFGQTLPVTPFAKGGVVASPTFFPHGGGLGLMGEAGSEAILPLRRGADGALGVAAPRGNGAPVHVTMNVRTADAASFAKSEGQIAAMIARASRRGGRYS